MAISDNTLAVLLDAPQPNMLPDEFNQKAFAFAAIQYTLGLEINATVAALNLNATNSISTDSMAIALADRNFEVEPNKSYSLGMSVRIAADVDPTNWMNGDVTAYDTLTGNISVHVTSIQGSGTYTAWTISQSVGGLTSGSVDTNKIADLAVTAAKIANLAVTAAKLAAGAATLAKLDRTGASGKVLTAQGVNQEPIWDDLPFIQAPQNLTASRALNTTYTNSASKPIFISVSAAQGVNGTASLIVDGVIIGTFSASTTGEVSTCCAPVPPGKTYRVTINTGTLTLNNWTEFH